MGVNAEKISDAELEVMKIIWKADPPVAYSQIRAQMEEESRWESSTIRTLIRRLVEKGALVQEKRDVYYYTPTIGEAEFMEQRTQAFVHQVYGGNAKGLVAALFKKDYINDEDIDELREFWDRKGEQK